MTRISVYIKKEKDGYRAYWLHRSWDCIKFDNQLDRLLSALAKMKMIVIV